LRLSVGLVEPFMRAWVLLAVAAFGSGGTGLFLLLLVLRVGWPPSRGSGTQAFLLNASMLYFLASIPLALVVLFTRRSFMRMPRRRQWSIASLLAGAFPLAIWLFIAFVN
jgi:hypothetical protein